LGLTVTGPEFRAALDAIAMSQREFASRFRQHEVAVSRWCAGKHAVPAWVPEVLALLEREHCRPG
jgi:DNA-binding transcriptional regulator YiaG